jgi:hypothetical protein
MENNILMNQKLRRNKQIKDICLENQLKSDILPKARLIVGSPIFTVKYCPDSISTVFACAGEKGKVIIADSKSELINNQEEIQFYKRMYFKDFPRNHVESENQ